MILPGLLVAALAIFLLKIFVLGADNVAVTPGTGATVAADEVGGVLHQRVKVSLGADGAATDAVGGAGTVSAAVQRVTLGSDDPAVASLGVIDDWDDNDAAKTVELGTVLTVTPVIDTGIYAAGDAVGGKQTLTNAARVSGNQTVLDTIVIRDLGNQKPNLTILLFDSDPTAATITNNAAFAFSTDITKLIGKINVVTADWETVDSKAICTLRNLGLRLKPSGSADLYAAVVLTSGTPTFASASDLVYKYGFKQN